MFEPIELPLKITPDMYEITSEERIVFWDHAVYSTRPLKCRVWGMVVFECDLFLVLSWWDSECDDPQERQDNSEFVTILKADIIERRKI